MFLIAMLVALASSGVAAPFARRTLDRRRHVRYLRTLNRIAALEAELFPPPRKFGRRRIEGTFPRVERMVAMSAASFAPGTVWQVGALDAISRLEHQLFYGVQPEVSLTL